MNTIQVDIVTPERKVYEGEASMVIAKGVDGELGVQPGHIPLVTPLKTSVLRIKHGNQEQLVTVGGGFLEVRPDKVTILAETAELPEEIDVNRAEAAKERAERILASINKEDAKFQQQQQALERALNRLKVGNRK